MNFVQTGSEVLWDHERGVALAVLREGIEVTTGAKREAEGSEEWLPIVRALPDDMIPGHPQMLGPATFEYDPTYDPDVVLEVFNDADYSPGAFKRYARRRVKNAARDSLAQTDWMFIRELETGEPVEDDIRTARAAIRSAVDNDLATIESLVPAEYPEFSPTKVTEARRGMEAVLKARDERARGKP